MSEISNRTFTQDELLKIRHVVQEGVRTQQEITDLREGLRDTVKHISEELDIKPKIINDAIKAKFKDDLLDKKEALDAVEDLIVMSKS